MSFVANILIADDDVGMLAWLGEILEDTRHQILTAQDGLEAQSLLNGHAVDLVITDVYMPNGEGLGLIRNTRKYRPEVAIIAISGGDPEVLLDAKRLGAHAALRKPITAKALTQCVYELLSPNPRSSVGDLDFLQ